MIATMGRRDDVLQVRHQAKCAIVKNVRARCNCRPSYRARVRDVAGKAVYSGWRKDKAAVIAWRQEAVIAARRGLLNAPAPLTVKTAGAMLVKGMSTGAILTRSGTEYKPSAVRSYETSLEKHIYPTLASTKVSSLRRADVQRLVEHLRDKQLAASTVHNSLDPLRVIVKRAIDDDILMVDPFLRLSLPAVRNFRDRIEAPNHALELIDALPEGDRAFWALAFFAALRRGELRALRCCDVDFDREVISVTAGWDPVQGRQAPKSDAGHREIPMSRDPLRGILRAHQLQSGRHGTDLFLGREADKPFVPSTVRKRALDAWETAKLRPITAHEARHCAVSYFIACGWDWKRVTEVVGHSDVRTTMNRYAHLVPGDEDAAVVALDAYIARHGRGA